ncbi:MAG TPA: hypothetical protein VM286_01595 [Candidatus Thermoplasmatota archaeon]|nr:hypothetical protein [Candidatus Thermoplasmatota archaeon]
MNMTHKIVIVMSLATMMVGSAMAAGGSRDVVVPSTLDLTGVGVFGINVCENVVPNPPGSPLGCGNGGVGAIIDVSALGTVGKAFGTCSTAATATSVGTDYSFSCGSDRNDDTFVSNAPTPSCVNPTGRDAQCDANEDYVDDFADGGSQANTSIALCARIDTTGSPATLNEDLDAGGDWDDIAVFVATTLSPASYVGIMTVTVSMTANTGCTPSGH